MNQFFPFRGFIPLNLIVLCRKRANEEPVEKGLIPGLPGPGWQIVDFDTRSLSQLTISAPLENTRRKMDRQIMHCAFPADSWHRRGQQSNPRPAECPDSSRALFKRSETLARNLRLDKPDRLEKAYERPGRRVAEETLPHHGRSSLGSQTDGPARAQCESGADKTGRGCRFEFMQKFEDSGFSEAYTEPKESSVTNTPKFRVSS